MKKTLLFLSLTLMLLVNTGCNAPMRTTGSSSSSSTTSSSSTSGSQSLLGSLLSGLIGNSTTITKEKIIGTWNYSSPECRFTSESALAQAGGAVAANTVEQKLAEIYPKIGITTGKTSFTFNEDNTCVMVFGGKSISGTYTINSETREIAIKSTTGLIKLNAQAFYSYTTLSLLFDADKLLTLAKMLSAFTGQGSSTMSAINAILENYEGLMIGMNLQK